MLLLNLMALGSESNLTSDGQSKFTLSALVPFHKGFHSSISRRNICSTRADPIELTIPTIPNEFRHSATAHG